MTTGTTAGNATSAPYNDVEEATNCWSQRVQLGHYIVNKLCNIIGNKILRMIIN